MFFTSRRAAGCKLAEALEQFEQSDTVIVALPRGGVVIGVEVAETLHAPLGIILVRKIRHPLYSEYAVGAVTEQGKAVYNKDEIALLSEEWLKEAEREARRLLARRRKLYFSGQYKMPSLQDKTVIIVDDGIATGLSMHAAVLAVRNDHPKKIIVAAPVTSRNALLALREVVDDIIVLDDLLTGAVASHYLSFPQINDNTVRLLLEREQRYGIQTPTTVHA